MFRSASDRQHFISRQGSHSTKGRANGRVDVLPPNAREGEAVYASAKTQWRAVENIAESLKAKISALKADERYMHKPHILAKIKEMEGQLHDLSDTRGKLALVARAVGLDAYGWAFRALAEVRLPKDMFRSIDEEVELLMGRKSSEVAVHAGESKRRRKQKLNNKQTAASLV